MISARPQPIGTAAFRPVVGGLSRPPVAAGFRPVVAGQYVRADRPLDSSALTFLERAPAASGGVHWSVVVSPRIVWQVMNAAPTESAPTRAVGGGRGAVARPRSSPSVSGGDDRLMVLRTHTTSATVPPPSHDVTRVDGPPGSEGRSGATPPAGPPAERSATENRFTWLRNQVRVDATGDTLVGSRVTRGATNNRDTIGYSPVVLALRSGAGRTDDRWERGSLGMAWESPFGARLSRGRTEQSDIPTTAARGGSGTDAPLLVNTVVVRMLRRFGRQSSPGFRDGIWETDGTRESTTAEMTFGRTAEVGAYRPAPLVPAIYRVSQSEVDPTPDAESVLGGSRTAGAFAGAVVGRLVRTEADGVSPGAAPPVSTIVRTSAAPSAAVPQAGPATPVMFTPDRAPPVQSTPPGLPADLVQRLTEQVVRALDARALAARERKGGF